MQDRAESKQGVRHVQPDRPTSLPNPFTLIHRDKHFYHLIVHVRTGEGGDGCVIVSLQTLRSTIRRKLPAQRRHLFPPNASTLQLSRRFLQEYAVIPELTVKGHGKLVGMASTSRSKLPLDSLCASRRKRKRPSITSRMSGGYGRSTW